MTCPNLLAPRMLIVFAARLTEDGLVYPRTKPLVPVDSLATLSDPPLPGDDHHFIGWRLFGCAWNALPPVRVLPVLRASIRRTSGGKPASAAGA